MESLSFRTAPPPLPPPPSSPGPRHGNKVPTQSRCVSLSIGSATPQTCQLSLRAKYSKFWKEEIVDVLSILKLPENRIFQFGFVLWLMYFAAGAILHHQQSNEPPALSFSEYKNHADSLRYRNIIYIYIFKCMYIEENDGCRWCLLNHRTHWWQYGWLYVVVLQNTGLPSRTVRANVYFQQTQNELN